MENQTNENRASPQTYDNQHKTQTKEKLQWIMTGYDQHTNLYLNLGDSVEAHGVEFPVEGEDA